MPSLAFKYLKLFSSSEPKAVDRLIISAFLKKNEISVKNNRLLKSYIISESNAIEYQNLTKFIEIIDKEIVKFDIEHLIELFEFVISPADRIVTGAIYTPSYIRDYIVKNILDKLDDLDNWRSADIACGCGGFLYTLSKELKTRRNVSYAEIFRTNIFGLDIMPYSITRSKLLLSVLAVLEGEDLAKFQFNLCVGDALLFDWGKKIENFQGFGCLVGNPPYVCSRKIDEKTKSLLTKFEVCSSGHPDLYIPFFQIGIELLADNGFLGFITMNSFFKSLNGRALRGYFQKKKYEFDIVDFGTLQVFKKRSTYTCICIFRKTNSDSLNYLKVNNFTELNSTLNFKRIPYTQLKAYNGWNLQHFEIINKIESVGSPFSTVYKTRNGIATLKNEIYIFKPVKTDDDFYYLQNGSLYPIEKAICKSIVNPNRLTSQTDISTFTEKLIFPYEFIDNKAEVYSGNFVKANFPNTWRYLEDKRNDLSERDKGAGDYEKWFSFGRSQSLEKMKFKLFFPHITPNTPNYVINSNENLFFYNGIAVIGNTKQELLILKKLMSSRLFWFYIKMTSKPYSAGYLSLSKNYIKDFGIYDFSESDIEFILNEENQATLDIFFEAKYEIVLPAIS